MFSQVRYYFKKTPLIGALVDCTLKDHWNAFVELLTTIFFSFLPIIVALVVDHYTKDLNILMSLTSNISRGELFLYSTSILAPVFYTVMNERGEIKNTFPRKGISIFIYGAIMFFAAVVFALQRANVILQENNLANDSLKIFSLSIILLYLVIVYNNSRVRLNPPQEMQNQENDFTKKFQDHRD